MTRTTSSPRPPAWLIWSTAALTLACLAMAVTETSQWGHYLIDKGEVISLAGLAFIVVSGFVLYRQARLRVSLPFALPWLLYPVITQGDQIIDNLSITAMQVICQVLLTLIFWVPIAVLVLAARFGLQPSPGQPARGTTRWWTALIPGLRWIEQGRVREGSAVMALALLTLEVWVAYRLLGAYMVATLIALILIVLWRLVHGRDQPASRGIVGGEGAALVMLLVGVVVSFGLYIGYKNRPGAYQGSPSYLFDPSQSDAGYKIDAITVPALSTNPMAPQAAADAGQLLGRYADALQTLTDGYYILDRNYTWHFHNVLFARSWAILPDFRNVALSRIAAARALGAVPPIETAGVRAALAGEPALLALIDEMEAFLAFNFNRASLLETMSATFIETNDGLQHAAHIYEGEGKLVGMQLGDILKKHDAVLNAPNLDPALARFRAVTETLMAAYKDRVVGF